MSNTNETVTLDFMVSIYFNWFWRMLIDFVNVRFVIVTAH